MATQKSTRRALGRLANADYTANLYNLQSQNHTHMHRRNPPDPHATAIQDLKRSQYANKRRRCAQDMILHRNAA